jgi:hypothetical protein
MTGSSGVIPFRVLILEVPAPSTRVALLEFVHIKQV